MRQYEVWWAVLPEPIGRRPVLLLSRDAAYARLRKVIVAEITRTIRNVPQEVALGRHEGLPQRSVANLDNLHTVEIAELDKRVGSIAPGRIREVKTAMAQVLG